MFLGSQSRMRVSKLFLVIVIGALALAYSGMQGFAAVEPEARNASELLRKADVSKASNYTEFLSIIDSVSTSDALSAYEKEYLRYLRGWQKVFEGDYQAAASVLNEIANNSTDVTLRFRAGATLVNVLVLRVQYEEALSRLTQLLELLPQVVDKGAREQGLGVIAYLYNHVGEYELGMRYAKILSEENWEGRGSCTGGQLELQAIYKSTRLQSTDSRLQSVINDCNAIGEPVRAIAVKGYVIKLKMEEGRFDEAMKLLTDSYDAVVKTRSPRLTSEYEALLAQAYRHTGNARLAKQFAQRAIGTAVQNEYTEPLANAYRLLYLLSKEQGDSKSALSYHERYMAADKGYLDDVTARQLAYQRVKHEVDANRLQIDALNKQNQVLQLQQQLNKKAVENIRLYIALLAAILISIVLWAYKTKRSQMHFKKLSRRDGLTGIFNRPHFIELAEESLKNARKLQQDVCVVLCDLDHFKLVNDNFGHAEGDYVLQRAVAACQAHLRATDVFARIGGEEFGLLLANCSVDDARVRVERLRVAVAESNPPSGKFNVSASFGVASTSASGYELQTLMTHADAALYQAKRAGRNCVVVYGTAEAPNPSDAYIGAQAV
jgi:diguanylate cyclase (GGDEF)-like protein